MMVWKIYYKRNNCELEFKNSIKVQEQRTYQLIMQNNIQKQKLNFDSDDPAVIDGITLNLSFETRIPHRFGPVS